MSSSILVNDLVSWSHP